MNSERVPRLAAVGCLLALLTWGVRGTAHASIVTANPSAWHLTLGDDFDGTSLNSDYWANRLPGIRKSAVNTADAVSVGNGLLTIKTYTDGGTNYTGMIGSQSKFEQKYGYFEARMKFHSSAAQWSAFWLTSPTFGNPVGDPATAGTEIDIVEHRAIAKNGDDLRDRYVSAVHWDGYAADHKQTAKTNGPLQGLGNDSWHTYALKWSPGGYEYYFDDTLVTTITNAVSQRPEYVILSSEVENGGWAGTVPVGGYGSLASTETNVQVDYVRVYQYAPEPASTVTLAVVMGLGLMRRRRTALKSA